MRTRTVIAATAVLLCPATGAWMAGCSTSQCSETLLCGEPASDALAPDVTGADTLTADTVTADTLAADASPDAPDSSAADVQTENVLLDAPDAPPDAHDAGTCGTGLECIPGVPAGFNGPVAVVIGTGDGGTAPQPPACKGAYAVDAVDAFESPIFSAATCSCKCGPVTNGCSSPVVETFTDNVCINSCNQVLVGNCTGDSCASSTQSARITQATQPSGGACTPTVSQTVPPWNPSSDWGTSLRACVSAMPPSDAGCPATDLCAPVPSAPFSASICVWQAGNVTCSPSYPVKTLVFASGTDTRACSNQCTCGSPSGVSCSATITVSSSSSTCGGGTLLLPGQCATYASTTTPYVSATVTASGGSCASGGASTPTGTIAPSGPTTVCCTP